VHRATFAVSSAYLSRDARGMAAAQPWFPDLGPELSRSFRSLKIWMTIQHYGRTRLGRSIERSCALAGDLAAQVQQAEDFELAAPPGLNIVCFRYLADGRRSAQELDALNRRIVQDLQLQGTFVPSSTVLRGQTCIRAAITNHRTTPEDIEPVLGLIREVAPA
jgi:glutamate/tyrosine decarboxylase-like PLP-dependent enzyme